MPNKVSVPGGSWKCIACDLKFEFGWLSLGESVFRERALLEVLSVLEKKGLSDKLEFQSGLVELEKHNVFTTPRLSLCYNCCPNVISTLHEREMRKKAAVMDFQQALTCQSASRPEIQRKSYLENLERFYKTMDEIDETLVSCVIDQIQSPGNVVLMGRQMVHFPVGGNTPEIREQKYSWNEFPQPTDVDVGIPTGESLIVECDPSALGLLDEVNPESGSPISATQASLNCSADSLTTHHHHHPSETPILNWWLPFYNSYGIAVSPNEADVSTRFSSNQAQKCLEYPEVEKCLEKWIAKLNGSNVDPTSDASPPKKFEAIQRKWLENYADVFREHNYAFNVDAAYKSLSNCSFSTDSSNKKPGNMKRRPLLPLTQMQTTPLKHSTRGYQISSSKMPSFKCPPAPLMKSKRFEKECIFTQLSGETWRTSVSCENQSCKSNCAFP